MNKILVINGKGGVGKTTASIELIAPYLFLRNEFNKVSVFSFDEENFLNNFYEESSVLSIKVKKVNSADMEADLSSVLLSDKPTVVDVGANKTTTYILKTLENTGLIHAIDMIVIPITDGEQDSLNAKSVYSSIKRMSKDIPVVFVLSRYVCGRDVQIQFEAFFDILYPILEIQDKKYITLIDSDVIKFAKKASKTIYEMSMDKTDYDTKIKGALKAKLPKDEILAMTKQKRIFKLAQEYRVEVLNNAFEVLDENT